MKNIETMAIKNTAEVEILKYEATKKKEVEEKVKVKDPKTVLLDANDKKEVE
jgi:hypothetical protein